LNARCLLTVSDTFLLSGSGARLIVVPGILPEHGERFQAGTPVRLVRPDGTELETEIGGIEQLMVAFEHSFPSQSAAVRPRMAPKVFFQKTHNLNYQLDSTQPRNQVVISFFGLTKGDVPIGTQVLSIKSPPEIEKAS
jgi:hypothetical protein